VNREAPFARLQRVAAATGLPGIETGTSYGRLALKVAGKVIAALKDEGNVYLPCPFELKELLLEAQPDVYWETDHYKGWPGLLVRLAEIGDEELAHRLSEGWRQRATKTLRTEAAR
jgi:hypothetical protein